MTTPTEIQKAEAEYNRLTDLERERILKKIGTERGLTEVIPYTKYSSLRFADFRDSFQVWIAEVLADPVERRKIPSLNIQRGLFDA